MGMTANISLGQTEFKGNEVHKSKNRLNSKGESQEHKGGSRTDKLANKRGKHKGRCTQRTN